MRLVAARIRAQLQYRASFAMETFGTLLVSFIDFVAILVIFANVPQLGSWSMPEVALLYGISGLAFAITSTLMRVSSDPTAFSGSRAPFAMKVIW